MRILHIGVLDKKATYLSRDGDIVCGNSDYVIEFAFDTEWAAHEEKIARFIWNGAYKDVTFTGTSCPVPIITNATQVEVGVYAGDLSTTTPAVIGCQKSILCQSTSPGGIPFTKGEKGDPGVGEPFDFNIEHLNSKYRCDKTTAEIIAAYLEGKVLRVTFQGATSTQIQVVISDKENLIGKVRCFVIFADALYTFHVFNSDGTETVSSFKNASPHVPIVGNADNGKILGVYNKEPRWLSPSEIPGVDDVFVVNFTGPSPYTCDKTLAEIIAAYFEGKTLYATYVWDGSLIKTSCELDVSVTDNVNLIGVLIVKFYSESGYERFRVSNDSGEDTILYYRHDNCFVPSAGSGSNGRVLSVVNGVRQWIDPSELGIDNVFTVNYTSVSGGHYECEKTTSEILAAYLAGKTMIGVLDNKYASTLFSYSVEDSENLVGYAKCYFICKDGIGTARLTCSEIIVRNTEAEERVTYHNYHNPFLPNRTSDVDNGKILGYVNNETQWLAPKELGIGGTNIITANSKAELPDPSTVEEGTIALVPSEGSGGGGGLPVAELTVDENGDYVITEAASAALSAAADMRMPIIITGQSGDGDDSVRVSVVANYIEQYGMRAYMATVVEQPMAVVENEGVWTVV